MRFFAWVTCAYIFAFLSKSVYYQWIKNYTVKLYNYLQRQVTLSVGENLAAGAEVGTIAAFDADQDGPIFYYIQGKRKSYHSC